MIEYPDKWISYSELEGSKPNTKKLSDDAIKALLKIQHTSPAAKSFINKLQQVPPNRLEKTADKLGMSVAQVKHLTGMYEKKEINEYCDYIKVGGELGKGVTEDDTKHVVAFFVIRENKVDGRYWAAVKNQTGEIFKNGKKLGVEVFWE